MNDDHISHHLALQDQLHWGTGSKAEFCALRGPAESRT
jgi:hypothetical protein